MATHDQNITPAINAWLDITKTEQLLFTIKHMNTVARLAIETPPEFEEDLKSVQWLLQMQERLIDVLEERMQDYDPEG